MTSRHHLIGSLFLASVFALAVTAQPTSAPTDKKSTSSNSRKRVAKTQDEGERVFQQNCSRCHASPEGFSPRVSGTIVRHMRVRASLSQHDEEALLHFFNP
jgi:cytochrome c5